MTDDKTSSSDGHEAPDDSAASGDGKTVPLSALEDERSKRQALEIDVAELRGRLEGMGSSPSRPAAPPKRYTRHELDNEVAAGKITQSEADRLLDDQRDADVDRRVDAKLDRKERETRASEQLAAYTELVPQLTERGSDARAKVQREFKALVDIGHPADSTATEVAAVRAALGPLDTLRAAKAGRRTEPETHAESGGSGGDAGDSSGDGSPPMWKKMSASSRRDYDKLIERGVYNDRAHVVKALERSSPRVRARAGLQ